MIAILVQCYGCGQSSQQPDDSVSGDHHPANAAETPCFDFRGFSVFIDMTDEEELLRIREDDLSKLDFRYRPLSWDGQVWGTGRTSFAAIYASYAGSSEQSEWNRFDAANDEPTFDETHTNIVGRSDIFGWMGLASGFIYTTTDIEDAPPIRASADVIGQLLPYMVDPEAEFIDQYVEGREDRFERQAHAMDSVSSTRLSSWIDEARHEVHQILHIYGNDDDAADHAIRLIYIFPELGMSRVIFVRFRSATCDKSVVPRNPDDLERAYPGHIDPELVLPFAEAAHDGGLDFPDS